MKVDPEEVRGLLLENESANLILASLLPFIKVYPTARGKIENIRLQLSKHDTFEFEGLENVETTDAKKVEMNNLINLGKKAIARLNEYKQPVVKAINEAFKDATASLSVQLEKSNQQVTEYSTLVYKATVEKQKAIELAKNKEIAYTNFSNTLNLLLESEVIVIKTIIDEINYTHTLTEEENIRQITTNKIQSLTASKESIDDTTILALVKNKAKKAINSVESKYVTKIELATYFEGHQSLYIEKMREVLSKQYSDAIQFLTENIDSIEIEAETLKKKIQEEEKEKAVLMAQKHAEVQAKTMQQAEIVAQLTAQAELPPSDMVASKLTFVAKFTQGHEKKAIRELIEMYMSSNSYDPQKFDFLLKFIAKEATALQKEIEIDGVEFESHVKNIARKK